VPPMTRETWWNIAKVFLGIPLLGYALLSIMEPQKELWRKPTKKVWITLIVSWAAVGCFIVFVFIWNALR
jgi:Flp pilus assembly protein TadB